MDEENRQKMITAMRMMKEACRSNDSWDGCEKCPFDSFCTMLQRSAIELYEKRNYETSCPIAWEPDDVEEEEQMKEEILSPCDYCTTDSWFPANEHGENTACFRCKYYLLLKEREEKENESAQKYPL